MKSKTIAVIMLSMVSTSHVSAQSNIAPDNKWAWSENCGWTNWQHDAPSPGDGVLVADTFLAGFVWCENIGWINLGNGDGPYANDMEDSSTFGVNIDIGTDQLSGFAWAENVGWINFEGGAMAVPPNAARLDGCRFRGFAWGENVGWINLDNEIHFVEIQADCPADFNCDGDIDAADLADLLADWGSCAGPCEPGDPVVTCRADFDGDCDVDAADLAELLADWGACPL